MKVSVIIPVFNSEQYLNECIESAAMQSLDDIEIICVDDGSKDGSKGIILKKAESDKRIRYIYQNNSGAAEARNNGIRNAKGEFVFFLDSDDFLPSADTLQKLYSAAKVNDAKMCGGSLARFNGQNYCTSYSDTQKKYIFTESGRINYYDYQFDLGFQRFIYDRLFLIDHGIYFPRYKNFEDPVFMVKAGHLAQVISAIPDTVYVYRDTPNSASKCISQEAIMDAIRGMMDNLDYAEKNGLLDLYRLTYRRLNKEMRCEIEYALCQCDQDLRLFSLLMKCNSKINWSIVEESDCILESLKTVHHAFMKYMSIRSNPIIQLFRKVNRLVAKVHLLQ